MQASEQAFYLKHGKISEPGKYYNEIKHLPKDIGKLCDIIQGIMVHETDADLFGIVHPPSRFYEMSLRTAENILNRIIELNQRPLWIKRDPKERIIGTCRDFALLLTSMCRTMGIPARLRIGFSKYTVPDPDFDAEHTLVEYWSEEQSRWIIVDPRVSQYHFEKKKYQTPFDFIDIPHAYFMKAGQVWLDCLAGVKDANDFGFGAKREYKGLWYIRNRLMHDLAALQKWEMLPWDVWGYMFHEPPHVNPSNKQQIGCITTLAQTINSSVIDLTTINQLWANPNLQVPSIVIAYDRYQGPNAAQLISV